MQTNAIRRLSSSTLDAMKRHEYSHRQWAYHIEFHRSSLKSSSLNFWYAANSLKLRWPFHEAVNVVTSVLRPIVSNECNATICILWQFKLLMGFFQQTSCFSFRINLDTMSLALSDCHAHFVDVLQPNQKRLAIQSHENPSSLVGTQLTFHSPWLAFEYPSQGSFLLHFFNFSTIP